MIAAFVVVVVHLLDHALTLTLAPAPAPALVLVVQAAECIDCDGSSWSLAGATECVLCPDGYTSLPYGPYPACTVCSLKVASQVAGGGRCVCVGALVGWVCGFLWGVGGCVGWENGYVKQALIFSLAWISP